MTDDLAEAEAQLVRHSAALAEAVDRTIAGWVIRSVITRMEQWQGTVPAAVVALAETAGERARNTVGADVADLLALDIDQQTTAPLAMLRGAVVYPTQVLEAAGVPHVERDAVEAAMFPDDVYALGPATYADIDPSLHDLGMEWGAAKAFVHLARRRAEGQR